MPAAPVLRASKPRAALQAPFCGAPERSCRGPRGRFRGPSYQNTPLEWSRAAPTTSPAPELHDTTARSNISDTIFYSCGLCHRGSRTRRSPYPYAVRVRLPKIILNMVSSVERCGLPLPQGEEDHPSALCTACSFRTEYILAHTTRLSPQSDDEEARGTKPRSLPAVSVLMPTVGDCLV